MGTREQIMETYLICCHTVVFSQTSSFKRLACLPFCWSARHIYRNAFLLEESKLSGNSLCFLKPIVAVQNGRAYIQMSRQHCLIAIYLTQATSGGVDAVAGLCAFDLESWVVRNNYASIWIFRSRRACVLLILSHGWCGVTTPQSGYSVADENFTIVLSARLIFLIIKKNHFYATV